jgi:carboxyl-terminal processing protease
VKSMIIKPGYGYVWVTNFQENTTEDLKAALKAMDTEKTPLNGLILDLRDNPGGLLNQAISVSDLFLDKGVIVSIKGRQSRNTKEFTAHSDGTVPDYPLVLLINGGSASASEIVSGALQDHKRALIMGTTSFGKGSVQTVESLRDGYGLKFTIARYYTPSGRSIQAQGIVPDITVAQRTLPKEEKGEKTRLLKEKDLKNHLTPEAGEPESDSEPAKEKKKTDDGEKPLRNSRHGPLDHERLMADYQVQRALEILVSYDIFKGIHR